MSGSEQPPREPLARYAGLTGAATLTSRILGLARDQTLAAVFGAGNAMDAFVVAFRIPNLVRDLFAEGAMSAAFVPTFTRELSTHGKEAAFRLGNNVINALLIATGVLVVAGIVFAHPLIALYAGSFASVPGKLELTERLTRIVLPFLPMVAVAAAAMGMLNSLHHYFVPALSPAMFNIATIAGVFALVPLMPRVGLPPIMAVAIAALAGGVGQVAIQWPALRREGFRYRLTVDPRNPALQRVLVLMGPGTIGLAATQVNLFVNTLLATSQGTGAASWLTYAFRLMYLPIGLFGVSIGTAVLPAVSRHATAGDVLAMRRTIARGLALMLMLNVPATLGLIVLATPIVQLLFERGRFLPADTAATASAVRLYAGHRHPREHRGQPRPRARARLRRACARHVDRGDHQCRAAALAAARAARRPRGSTLDRDARQGDRRGGGDGGRGVHAAGGDGARRARYRVDSARNATNNFDRRRAGRAGDRRQGSADRGVRRGGGDGGGSGTKVAQPLKT
ncbi:MAG: murein biosynthesis integral membrane protein MurJ [Acidobacteria bacterium]|nr:murein biosynthesis integral membrane protein MurJ [Acidobacteriota bacterium]